MFRCVILLVFLVCSVQAKHRNVLVIFADDGGFMQTAYNNTVCDTPSLDALAARSVVFNRGYTGVSSCSPSRSVILSGLPQHQNGMYGLQHSVHHFQSFSGVRSLPRILSNNGIFTGIVGKYHVAPREVYTFDYMKIGDVNQVGRNITYMKGFVREFLQQANQKDKPFFLYIAFHDPHRAGGNYGPFMNKWGDGQAGHGRIPDWNPIQYRPEDVIVPYFLPDTPATRGDIAAMYTSFNRMDQGIGLFMKELETSGHLDDTLVLWTSDNGIPFPGAKTNLYEPGMGEPMMISSPDHKEHWGKHTNGLASITDFVPTILDWFKVKYPKYTLNGEAVTLSGRSLLPLAAKPSETQAFPHVFSSHDLHEVTMAYPMRVMRNDRFRLIHNINNRAPFPLATDLYDNPTFLDILNRTRTGQATHWFKTLQQYYYRDEWELYDVTSDPKELKNLATDPDHHQVLTEMKSTLQDWLVATNDPWRCMPHYMLLGGHCYPMDNYFSEKDKPDHSLYYS